VSDSRTTLVRQHTRITPPGLCPEIRLRLITTDCPLWRGDEAAAAEAGVPHPFWGFAWPGGQAIARHLLDHPERVAGRSVLDFGAGCGIGAIAAAMAGARGVTASEIDPIATAAVEINAALNDVTVHATTRDLVAEPDAGWDVILAGDMFYDVTEGTRTGAWLRQQATRGARVLIGDPHRGFLDHAGVEILASYDALADNDRDGSQRVRTAVLRMWRSQGR
jgi:predicted nicotinamide N-methyase